ncbi:MAG: ATP-binding protein, partial [Bacteroidetes bacterium]|nr:ATP-binding protein [Bacteroidota bacterium]
PVAVIKSKMELLLQSSNLNEENLTTLDTSLKQLYKLERINKAILLLNKLEHKNLFESKSVNIAEEVRNIVSLSGDFIAAQNLTVNLSLQKQITFNMNASLLNILLGNLISNAIKHSTPGGSINIIGTENRLTISNSALEPKNATENFFDRFYKESNLTESVGLGLTIAKKICDLYGIKISNRFSKGMYVITLEFNKSMINEQL